MTWDRLFQIEHAGNSMASSDLDPLARSILQKRQKLKLIEGAYRKAQELVKSPDWGEIREKALDRVGWLVRGYQGGEAVQAVYVLGQLRELLTSTDGPMQVIREYESERKSLGELVEKQ